MIPQPSSACPPCLLWVWERGEVQGGLGVGELGEGLGAVRLVEGASEKREVLCDRLKLQHYSRQ